MRGRCDWALFLVLLCGVALPAVGGADATVGEGGCGDRCMCCMCGCGPDPAATACSVIPRPAACAADPSLPECAAARERYCCHRPGGEADVFPPNASNHHLGWCGEHPTYPAECGAPRCKGACPARGGASPSPALWLLLSLLSPVAFVLWLWFSRYDVPAARAALRAVHGAPFKFLPRVRGAGGDVAVRSPLDLPLSPRGAHGGESARRPMLSLPSQPSSPRGVPVSERVDGSVGSPRSRSTGPRSPAAGAAVANANPLDPRRQPPAAGGSPHSLDHRRSSWDTVSVNVGAGGSAGAGAGADGELSLFSLPHRRNVAAARAHDHSRWTAALDAAKTRTQRLQVELEKCPIREKAVTERLRDIDGMLDDLRAQLRHEEDILRCVTEAEAAREREMSTVHQAAYERSVDTAKQLEVTVTTLELKITEAEREVPKVTLKIREAELTAAQIAGQEAHLQQLDAQVEQIRAAVAATNEDAAAILDAADALASEAGEWEAKSAAVARRIAAIDTEATTIAGDVAANTAATAREIFRVEEASARAQVAVCEAAAFGELMARKWHELVGMSDALQTAVARAGKNIDADRQEIVTVASRASLAIKSSARLQFKIDTIHRTAGLVRAKTAEMVAAEAAQETLLAELRMRLKHLTNKSDELVKDVAILQVDAGSCEVAARHLREERQHVTLELSQATAAAQAALDTTTHLEAACTDKDTRLRAAESEIAEKNGHLAAKEVLIAQEKDRLLGMSNVLTDVINKTLTDIRANESQLSDAMAERDEAEARMKKRERKLSDLEAEMRTDNVRYAQELVLIDDENERRRARVVDVDSRLESQRTLLLTYNTSGNGAPAVSPSPPPDTTAASNTEQSPVALDAATMLSLDPAAVGVSPVSAGSAYTASVSPARGALVSPSVSPSGSATPSPAPSPVPFASSDGASPTPIATMRPSGAAGAGDVVSPPVWVGPRGGGSAASTPPPAATTPPPASLLGALESALASHLSSSRVGGTTPPAAPLSPTEVVGGLVADGASPAVRSAVAVLECTTTHADGSETPGVAAAPSADECAAERGCPSLLTLRVRQLTDHDPSEGLRYIGEPVRLPAGVACVAASCDHLCDHGFGPPRGEVYLILEAAAGAAAPRRMAVSLFGVVGREKPATFDLLQTFSPTRRTGNDNSTGSTPVQPPLAGRATGARRGEGEGEGEAGGATATATGDTATAAELIHAARPGDSLRLAYVVGPRGYQLHAANLTVHVALLDPDGGSCGGELELWRRVAAGGASSGSSSLPRTRTAGRSKWKPRSGGGAVAKKEEGVSLGAAAPAAHARNLPAETDSAPWPSFKARTTPQRVTAPDADTLAFINAATDPSADTSGDLLGGISFALDSTPTPKRVGGS